MKLSIKCISLGLAVFGLASCSQEALWSDVGGNGKGTLKLHLSADADITSALPEVRAVSREIETPPISEFGIRITKTDGKTEVGREWSWTSVKNFVDSASFTVGTYTIETFYGQPDAQGSIEDNDKQYEYAYFYGKTEEVTVLDGQTTDVELHAALANAIVQIEYTEEFKNYFIDWETTLQTAGQQSINLGGREAINYVVPGEVAITIKAEQQNGEWLMLNPGKFTANPQHMYKMRYNIYNGQVGQAQLAIEFDESLETEPIVIDLSDVLGNFAAPTVTPDGFESNQTFATFEGTKFDGSIKYDVVAPGQISAAKFTVNSDTYHPSFLSNGEVDLCKATDAQQAAMAAEGIKAVGFFNNPGKLAMLDISQLCKNLPSGIHNFEFQVTDSHFQTHEAVKVTVAIIPKEISAEGQTATFGDGYADIVISYNGPDPTAPGSNPFSFRIQGDNAYENCEIISMNSYVADATRSDLFPVKDYVYRVSVPFADRDELPVKVYFDGKELTDVTTKIPFAYPSYKLEYDAWAKSIKIRIGEDDDAKSNLFFKKLHVFVDGTRIDTKNLTKQNGIITIPNRTPGTEYMVSTTLESSSSPKAFGTSEKVTTEAAEGVPNGDFENLNVTIDNKTINQGGTWTITTLKSATKYQTTLTMTIKEPNGWTSSNSLTCDLSGSNTKNSWYAIPSVYNTTLSWISNQPTAKVGWTGQSAYTSTADIYKNLTAASKQNAMVIRNVAYDSSAYVVGDQSQKGDLDFSNYFCPIKPTISNSTAGYMYLGSSTQEGTSFNHRPTELKGEYKYVLDETTKDATEKGVVTVTLLAADGKTVLGSGKAELSEASTYSSFSAPIEYTSAMTFGLKPTTLKIYITSSNKSTINTTNYCNKEECCSRGATLYIDNLTFEY